MVIAYIDESGNLTSGNRFFVAAVVATTNKKIPNSIFKKTRRLLGKKKGKIGRELKFTASSERIRKFLVNKLSSSKITCWVVVVDLSRSIEDSPANYGLILSWVIKYLKSQIVLNEIIIDRKFDKERDQLKLLNILKKARINLKYTYFRNSINEDGIKLADFVAGFYWQYYNKRMLPPKTLEDITKVKRVSWKTIKRQKAEVPKGSDGLKD